MSTKAEPIANKIEDILDRVVMVIILLFLCVGAYIIYDNIYVYYNATGEKLRNIRPEPINEETLARISKDAVAWITLDGTTIDYPIMQGETNMDYLNKDPYGGYSLSGSIFLDSRNKADFTDEYNLVYGHHMEHGYMFGALDSWYKKDFFDEHTTGTLYVRNKEIPIDIVAIISTDAAEDVIFDVQSGLNIEQYCKEKATNKRKIHADRSYLALSTCKDPLTTERTVLMCQLNEKDARPARSLRGG